MSQPSQQSQICRDEYCSIEEIHEAHGDCRDDRCPIVEFHERHEHEHKRYRGRMHRYQHGLEACASSRRLPWKRPAAKVLDEIIVETTSLYHPKRCLQIYHDVEQTYGEIAETETVGLRQIYWHLDKLVSLGRIWRADLGSRLYAYLRAGSKIFHDHSFLRDLVSGEGDLLPMARESQHRVTC